MWGNGKMKKIILFLVMFCVMAFTAMAIPQVPYILYGHVDWSNAPYSGATLEITHNGVTQNVVTDGNGAWSYQLSTYTIGAPVNLKVTDGCGTGDVCTKSVVLGSIGNEDFAEVSFSLSGVLTCPIVNCPSCSGGGCSCSYSESKCNNLYPPTKETCTTIWYETGDCPAEKVCPPEKVCGEVPTCETCPEVISECEECPETAEFSSIVFIVGGIISVLFAIAGLVLGGYKWFPGLKGLSNYYIQQGLELMKQGKFEEAQKKINQGLKTMKTAVEKGKEGEYNK